jgi:hypothetical protein
MPILARGRYSVRVFGPGKDPFISGEAASFDYFPYNLALLPIFGIFVIAGFVVWNLIDREYPASRNLVLLPAAVAVFWGALSEPAWGIVVSAPLVALAAVFLIWRVAKVRSVGGATALVILGAFVGAGFSVLFEIGNLGIALTVALAIPVAFLGIIIGIPYAVTRAAVGHNADNARAWAGTGAALPLGLFIFLVVYLASRSAVSALLAALALFIIPAILFALLVRWNAWARDVATGSMFESRKVPSTELAGEVRSIPADGASAGPANGDTGRPEGTDPGRPVDEKADRPSGETTTRPPDGDSPVSPA